MKIKMKLMLILLAFVLGQTELAWTQSQQAPWSKGKRPSKQSLTEEQAAFLKDSERWMALQPLPGLPGTLETPRQLLSKIAAATLTLQAPIPETGAFFGDAVLMADLNGDGHSDAVVGAPRSDVSGLSDAGQVLVYFGPNYSSPPLTINDPAPESSARFGTELAAGDLNGDGIKDLVVGVPAANIGSNTDAGEVFVFLGGPSFDATSDFTLNDPAPEAFANFGTALGTGDINGDGIDDLLVGADDSDIGSTTSAGEAFVFLGGNPFNTAADFTLQDPAPESFANFGAEAAIGDLNGDGKKDVIITAPLSDIGSATSAGQAFVFLGGSSFDTNADFTLQDPFPATNIRFGLSVANGDVNGDNFDDVFIGSFGSLTSNNVGEETFVFLGAANFDATDDGIFGNPAPDPRFRFVSNVALGDVNNDNIKDVVIGIFGLVANGYERAGQALVFHGGSPFNTTLDATLQDPNPEFEARFGIAVAIANPKGDILVGGSGSAIFTPGQRDFFGANGQGSLFRFNLSTSGTAIDPFSMTFVAISSTSLLVWTVTYPSLPIVNNQINYTTAEDTLQATFVTPDRLEGIVSSRRTSSGRLFRTGVLSLFAKRGGAAGEAFVFSSGPPSGPATINLSPVSFQFTATPGGSNPAPQTLRIGNGGGNTLNWSATDDASWLTLSSTSGSISPGGGQNVTLVVNIAGLTAGTYNATITVTDPNATNSPQTAAVTLTLQTPQKPTISLNPTTFQFTATQGGSNPSSQTLNIGNTGNATLNWRASDNVTWLTLSPTSGSIVAGGNQNVTLFVNVAGLTAGTFNATITVSDPNATNSPQTATATLTIQPPTPKPTIALTPRTFQFTAIEGRGNPTTQTLSIGNTGSSGSTLNWTGTDNASWLTLSPTSGSIASGSNQNVTLAVDVAGLAAGTYNATITVTDANATNSPQTATVNLSLAPANTFCSTDVPKSIPDANTTTSTLAINNDLVIGDVNVRLFITHSFDADLDVFLTSPNGTTVELFTDVGSSGDNFGSNCSPVPNCVIDDQAATSIASGSAPFVGSFRSEGRMLGVFNGDNARGTWTLTITDDLSGTSGTLNCWCLEISPAKPNDVGVTAIDLPRVLTLGNSLTVNALVRNFGTAAQNNFPVNYSINNGPAVTENFAGMLITGMSATKTFASFTPSTEGAYSFSAWTALSGDENVHNDTLPSPKIVLVRKTNMPPVLTTISHQTVRSGRVKRVPLSVFDAEGDTVTFSIPTNPGFLSISGITRTGNMTTATLVISPSQAQKGLFNASVQATTIDGEAALAFNIEAVAATLNPPASLAAVDAGNAVTLSWNAPAPAQISPYLGAWTGTTSQGLAFYLRVADDNFIDSLNARIRLSFPTFTCTGDFLASLVEVQGNKFDARVSNPATNITSTFHGTFASETGVSGTYDGYSGSYFIICGSIFSFGTASPLSAGTWQATKTGPGNAVLAVLQSFNIYRSSQPNARTTGTLIGAVNASTRTFTDSNPTAGALYYQITAKYDHGESDPTNEAGLRTRVEERITDIPITYALEQNYPNPFNPETTIRFQLPKAGQVVLKIFNIIGAEVRTLMDAPYQAGYHRIHWDGKDNNGHPVASGVYLYRLQAGNFSQLKKMSLLR